MRLKCLKGFHVEVAHRLTGMRPRRVKGKWVYLHSVNVLKAAGLCTEAECTAKRRANIAKTRESRRILEECK